MPKMKKASEKAAWKPQFQKIEQEIEVLKDQILLIDHLHLNEILFFRSEIASLQASIIQIIEKEAQHIFLKPEILEMAEILSRKITSTESVLPQFNMRDVVFPYKHAKTRFNESYAPLMSFESGVQKLNGPKPDIHYIQSFPYSDYELILNNYKLLCVDKIPDLIKDVIRMGLEWEPEIDSLIKKFVKPGSTVLDIGAHIGLHTLSMSLYAGANGKVLAFEPQRKIYRELVIHLAINECQNVTAWRCALGDRIGMAEMGIPATDNEGSRSIGAGTEVVPLSTLDAFQLENISFIKIDVENFEYEVLQGAYQTIMNNRPIIIIEVMARRTPDRLEKTIQTLNLLTGMGYHLVFISLSNYLALPTT